MIAVTVTDPGGGYYTKIFDADQIVIGRNADCDMVLDDGNVSGRHAQVSLKDGKFIVVDMDSTNGIYVNGRQVGAPMVVNGPNTVHIAVFSLSLSLVRS